MGNGTSGGDGETVALRTVLRAVLGVYLSVAAAALAAVAVGCEGVARVLKAAAGVLGSAYLECLLILWLNRDDDSGPRDER